MLAVLHIALLLLLLPRFSQHPGCMGRCAALLCCVYIVPRSGFAPCVEVQAGMSKHSYFSVVYVYSHQSILCCA